MKHAAAGRCLSVLLAAFVLAASAYTARSETEDPPYDVDHIGLYLNPDATGCDVALGAGEIASLEVPLQPGRSGACEISHL